MYDPRVPYLVNQILLRKLTYQEIITARPELQEQIDKYILDKGLINDMN